eukprot:Lithocolla_globosa_v1_NODE_1536_length_2506_cov_4.311710.p1 type:complete len:661 gc:universal NODE_1536_length_2506_cov_4.311710:2021-39(-)
MVRLAALICSVLAVLQDLQELVVQVALDSDKPPENIAREIARRHGLQYQGQVGELKGYYLLTSEDTATAEWWLKPDSLKRQLGGEEGEIVWAEIQKPLKRVKREPITFDDPLFSAQWFLVDKEKGGDVNVQEVWDQGIFGSKEVVVCIVDDGLDFNHPDMAPNYVSEASYDFNGKDPEPLPTLSDDLHGTRCGGEVAAAANDMCGVGVAPETGLSACRILSGQVNDRMEAEALNYRMDLNDIYSNSWGPWDNGATVEAPGPLALSALQEGVSHGRGGLGSIFMFASGNGGSKDNCNFDGYTNSIYTISIGALGRDGLPPSYQEPCSAHMAVTASSNSKDYITSTNPHETCTSSHGGTSAAAPLAAGILSLALSIRSDLTWRDFQHLVVETAEKINPNDKGWQTNGAGYHFHHSYGFGKINALKLVESAKNWLSIGKGHSRYESEVFSVKQEIPHDSEGLIFSYLLEQQELDQENHGNFTTEHVTVSINIKHSYRGDLSIFLTSPSGTRSQLATPRSKDSSRDGLDNWRFMSVVNWGEVPVGTWMLQIIDNIQPSESGTVIDWQFSVYGTSNNSNFHDQDEIKLPVSVWTWGVVSLLGVSLLGFCTYIIWVNYPRYSMEAETELLGLEEAEIELSDEEKQDNGKDTGEIDPALPSQEDDSE